MSRYLAAFILLVTLCGNAFAKPQPKQHPAESTPAAERPKDDKRGTKDAPLEVNSRVVQTDKEAADEAAKEAEQKRVNRWNIGLTATIAICAAFQVVAIFVQIAIYRKQSKMMLAGLKISHSNTQAALKSAQAAYGSLTFAEAQLEMMREKERARLDLEVKRIDLGAEVAEGDLVHLIATLSVRNIGASRAFIRRTFGTLITKPEDELLSRDYAEYSPLDLPEQFIDPDSSTVPVKVYLFPATTTAQAFAECLEQGIFSLHFYGFIEYETLGLRWTKHFGYDWKTVDRNSVLGSLYELSDPYPNSPMPAKDRITYGYWEPNEERDIPEYPSSRDQDGEQWPN